MISLVPSILLSKKSVIGKKYRNRIRAAHPDNTLFDNLETSVTKIANNSSC
jgi:hypothetical protein